ncbi:DUF4291 domain-containing protein [Sorangium sp. So ce131]|uniref:DUF4291 domain-containing protein n=1 Tax=Sorangium sp. So ce131 TaxID=3133282 RepID=UPI003F5EA059
MRASAVAVTVTESSKLGTIEIAPYAEQAARWPAAGRHILAQFDAETVVVYQAYRPSIARHAVAHQRLGGAEFSFGRMSWIKPNFLWMMFRSGWGTKQDQEAVLAIRVRRSGFDEILAAAVPSGFVPALYPSEEAWKAALHRSDVRLQWDPDHHPSGAPVTRRAIQLGLRGATLRRFAEQWTVGVEDISGFVAEQRDILRRDRDALWTPREAVYRPGDAEVARRVGIEEGDAAS